MSRDHGQRQTFEEIVEGWVFCGLRLLRLRWEKCRALADTDLRRETAKRILESYLEQMEVNRREFARNGESTVTQDLILQIGHRDRYSGPLLHGRFQVMESLAPPNTYYLVDHRMPDLLLREKGPSSDIRRFDSKLAAEETAAVMAERGESLKAYKAAERLQISPSNSKLTNMKEPVEMAAQKKIDIEKKSAENPISKKSETATPPKEKKMTAGRMFQDLIMEGKLTDDEIFAKVQKEFGLSDDKKTYTGAYRRDLTKAGKNPPGPIEAKAPKAETKAPKAETKAPKAETKAPKAGEARGVKPGRARAA